MLPIPSSTSQALSSATLLCSEQFPSCSPTLTMHSPASFKGGYQGASTLSAGVPEGSVHKSWNRWKSYRTLPNQAACQQEGITARGAATELPTQETWDQLTGFEGLYLALSTEEKSINHTFLTGMCQDAKGRIEEEKGMWASLGQHHTRAGKPSIQVI